MSGTEVVAVNMSSAIARAGVASGSSVGGATVKDAAVEALDAVLAKLQALATHRSRHGAAPPAKVEALDAAHALLPRCRGGQGHAGLLGARRGRGCSGVAVGKMVCGGAGARVLDRSGLMELPCCAVGAYVCMPGARSHNWARRRLRHKALLAEGLASYVAAGPSRAAVALLQQAVRA